MAVVDVMVTVLLPLAWRTLGVVPLDRKRMWSPVLAELDRYRCLVLAPPERPLSSMAIV